jgi:uncharacterized membrane protein
VIKLATFARDAADVADHPAPTVRPRASSPRLVRARTDFARALATTTALGSIAASMALALVQIAAPDPLDPLIASNTLELSYRTGALVAVALAVLLVVVLAGALIARGQLDRCERWSRLLSPLVLAALVPALLARAPWRERELAHLVFLFAFTLAAERLLRLSFAAWPRRQIAMLAHRTRSLPGWLRRGTPLAALLIIVGYYAIAVGHYTLLSHDRLATSTADLGEFDNLFFNALQGRPFRAVTTLSDVRDWQGLRVHAEFAMYLLLPFYALAPGAKTLLLMQAVIVALTAVPVYLLAARRLGPAAGSVLALVTLLLPVVQRPNFYDFHMTPLGMLLVAWLLFTLDVFLSSSPERRKPWRLLLCLNVILALAVREDVALGMAALGVWLMFARRSLATGAVLAAVALGYFACLQLLVMPLFGKHWYDGLYDALKAPGARGFSAVLLTLFSNPSFVVTTWLSEPKLLYLLHMTVPLAGLWLRRPWLLLAAVPGFASTLLVTNRQPMFQSSFQYTYLWVPYIVGASILALVELTRGKGPLERRAIKLSALGALLIAALGSGYQHGALLGASSILGGFGEKRLEITAEERAELHDLRRLTRSIPASASISGTEDVGPQLSTRSMFFHLTHGQPDYIVVGRPHGRAEHAYLRDVIASGEYVELARQGRFRLLGRKH